MRLRLTAASGAVIADGVATGTIENTDHMPAAWLARFGRTAAGHVLAAVGERLRGGGQTQATVAGRRLQGADAAAVAAGAGRLRAGVGTAAAGGPPAGAPARAGGARPGGGQLVQRDGSGGRRARRRRRQRSRGGRWTVWGRGGWSHFAGRADGGDLTLDADVIGAAAGADYQHGAVLAGLALAYSTGSGTYDHASERSGSVESTLLSVHPYARLALHERLAVWGLFGYGLVGHVTLDDAVAGTMETGSGMLMGAFGVDGLLLAAAQSGGLELAARADGLLLRMSSAAAEGLAASEAGPEPLAAAAGSQLRRAAAVRGRAEAGAGGGRPLRRRRGGDRRGPGAERAGQLRAAGVGG